MTTRTVRVILEGADRGLTKTFSAAGDAADRAAGRVDRLGASIDKNEQAYQRAGTALATFGAVTTGALVGSAAAAVSWQSDFAGVRKTVDDNAAGYAALSDELRGMARELPAAQGEIAGVAEAAGQLGVKRDDITGFTRTMIDLGETTNLSANDAATGLARFSNIMGTTTDQASNLGSSIVELGNNYATTEAEILQMGLRLAGAGRQAKLSEGEVLGLATALSSVGIEAEAGGTAFSRVLIEMGTSVDTQDAKLQTFAETAGMSAAEFSTAWRDDAGGAITAFISGLGQMEASGQSVQPVLDELGMTDIRVGDALRRAAAGSDIFTDAMTTGNTAFAENTALADEAAQRYDTVASRLQVLRNNAVDAAISLGDTFLPVLNAVALLGADALGAISDLPQPLQELVSWGGAAVGTTSLLAGGFLLLAPRALETGRALRQLGIIGPRAATGLKSLTGLLMGPWGIALAAGATALTIWAGKQAEARQRVEELRTTLDEQTGAITENTTAMLTAQLEQDGHLEYYQSLGGDVRDITAALEGETGARERVIALLGEQSRSVQTVSGTTERQDGAARSLTGTLERMWGETERATEAQQRLNEAQGAGEVTTEQLEVQSRRMQAQADAYTASQEGATKALQNWIPYSQAAMENGEEAAQAYLDLREQITGVSDAMVDGSGALATVNTETQEWAQAQADATETADDSWEDFWDGQTVSIDKWIAELERQQEAQLGWQENMVALSRVASQGVIDEFQRMGVEGAPLLAEALEDPAALARIEGAVGNQANAIVGAYADTMIDGIPVLQAVAARWGTDMADQVQAELLAGETTAAEVVRQYDLGATVEVVGDLNPYDAQVAQAIAFVNDSFATSEIRGDATEHGATLGLALGATNDSEATSDILGNHQSYIDELNSALGITGRSAATADILGENVPFMGSLSFALGAANAAYGEARVGANTNPFYGDVNGALGWASMQWATVNIQAQLRGGIVGLGAAVVAASGGRANGGPIVEYRALGGPVHGPGGPTDDLVPAMAGRTPYALSNGEFVHRTASVDHYGLGLMHAINEQRIDKMALLGALKRADGGSVQDYRHTAMAPRLTTLAPSYRPTPSQSADMSGITSQIAALGDRVASLAESVSDRPAQLVVDRRVMAEVVSASRSYSKDRGGR
ncbi:phage tail tape measure protein [Ornithinimicrobium sp. LYQ92]|uniref:phage tail tape measure protein n=1 Tax=Serinicoccus sp. LYQ92 TaxID=3378798 RepID=UPI003854AC87